MYTLPSKLPMLAFALSVVGLTPVLLSTEASAANDVKPMLSVAGKAYYDKKQAKNSAVGRWEKKATIQHGIKYSNWQKAKKTSFDCDSKFHQGNGKKLWTCKANGKPVGNVEICAPGKIVAKWAVANEANAKKGVRKAWEKLAAQHHGIKYSFYKNAKEKHETCGTDSEFPGKVVCRIVARPCK